MARARTVAAAVELFGAALVCATGAVLWAVRGAAPQAVAFAILAFSMSWVAWRGRHHLGMKLGAAHAFFWLMAIVFWATSGETALAVAAAVPAAPALFLAVADARAYFASDAVPRPPADPARAARLRRLAIPLRVTALLSLALAAVLGQQEWLLAWPGVMLAVLFGVLAWLMRRDALRVGAFAAAAIVGFAYVALGVLALTGPPWDRRTVQMAPFVFVGVLFLGLVVLLLAGRPPKPPPVPSPEPNR